MKEYDVAINWHAVRETTKVEAIQGGWKQVSLIQVAKAKLVSLKLWNDSSFFSKTFFGNKLRFLVNFL